MRTALTRGGVGVAALAVAASTVFIASPASAAPGEGTLTVTWFEDRYTDGIYDTTPTNPAGEKDQLRQSGSYLYLQTADDAWFGAPQRADGSYVFPDVPIGEADLYVVDPTGTNQNAFWDATEGAPEFMPQSNVSFTDGTFLHEDGTRTTGLSGPSSSAGRLTVNIAEEATTTRLVGMAGIGANAEVTVDGERTTGVAELSFLSNGTALPATEWDTGRFFAARGTDLAKLVPGEIGIAVDVDPRRYRIESVTAGSNIDTTLSIPLTQTDGVWTMETSALVRYFDSVVFKVALAPVALTDLTVTYFADNVLDGVYDPTLESSTGYSDEKRTTDYLYLHDSQGQWWATTANADGDFVFTDVPAGAATLHLTVPDPYVSTSVWDATDVTSLTEVRPVPQAPITFTGGTYLAPDGTEAPIIATDRLTAAVPLNLVEGEDAVEAGLASADQSAVVVDASGEPVTGATVELLANGTPLESTLLDGVYYSANLAAGVYGVRVTAPAGFQVTSVRALSALTGEELIVEGPAAAPTGVWTVSSDQLARNFDGVEWEVAVAALPVVIPGDGAQPGTGAGTGTAGSVKGSLASTGADAIGASIAGGSALLLLLAGAAALLIRRRAAQ
ncbi:hypothetical protein CLV46_3188 [Diaminobutyricimonas aerilata]|uniref:Alpha-amylase n=1 Tax=Diaminobutyricimonas aerilata TaxID=1162967 RepID=A0A2M9CNV1_9MICO|nr:carboxypeptidase-like regulatory domain-containing protein [Diaminobutyricimonas aerilata]PJJ73595.1 hypothetical protein CLV46_3188 [Diaminobutyricimonas aerilata]